jgi:alkanesulfonate monooxygenase SsuD/methylene tetrahydromethanopterin reductase-like flavin-dependent oxidoreductase (luciferase family)
VAPELVSYVSDALRTYPYDCVWMCDEFQYEDSFGTMLAMASLEDISVGTMVTFPWRNPLDLAQRFATITRFTKPGRQVIAGLGNGGAVQMQVMALKAARIALMRETVLFLRGMFAGDSVELGDFPELAGLFHYNTRNRAKLYFPPSELVPVVVAAAGPKMYELAGALADGVILSQLLIRTSYLGAKRGLVHEAIAAVEKARDESGSTRPFRRLYNIHVSVDRDGRSAKQWAKRNTSYCLSGAYVRYPEVLTQVGLDPEEIGWIAQAYKDGLGVEEAARRVSDKLVDESGCVFAGTPEEVTERVIELRRLLSDLEFDELVIGVPLGPDIPTALRLIGSEVLPPLLATVSA